MKHILTLLLVLPAAFAQTSQTGAGSIAGTVLDATTAKPISAAWVIANRAGAPSLAKHTKSGGDGAFQIQGFTAGRYSLCVRAEGDLYLDPCQWSGSPTAVALAFGQAVSGITLKLAGRPNATVIHVTVKGVH